MSSDILAENIKGFNRLTLQSTIKYSVNSHSEKNDAKIDPKIDQVVDTHTSDEKERKVTDTDITKGNSPHKLLINRLIPDIIPVVILPIDQMIVEDAAGSGKTLHACRMILSKHIVTDVTSSAAHFFWTPINVGWHGTDGTAAQDGNTTVGSIILGSPVRIGVSNTGFTSRT